MSYECEECGEEFDSERGLHVHESQMHDENEEEKDTKEDLKLSKSRDEKSDSDTISLSTRSAIAGVFIVGLSIGFAAGLTAGVFAGELQPSEGNGDSDGSEDSLASVSIDEAGNGTSDMSFSWEGGEVDLEGTSYAGSPDADTVIVSYEDYACGYCGRHNRKTFPDLVENHINEGEVQYFYKHFRLAGWGRDAAIASECIQGQSAEEFWTFKQTLYENQRSINGANVDSEIKDIVSELDIDQEDFEVCYDNQKSQSKVQSDAEEGQGFNYTTEGGRKFVAATPSFLIYDRESGESEVIIGAQPYSAFKSAIEQ